ncbi:MAG: alpha-1,2-fucosyltransferase [Bryobacteraceae bacterium]
MTEIPTPPQHIHVSDLRSVLSPFRAQSALVRSIVAVGCRRTLEVNGEVPDAAMKGAYQEAALLQLAADEETCSAIVVREHTGQFEYTLNGLAQQARDLSGGGSGTDLLLIPAHVLDEMMTPLTYDFCFRAVATFLPEVRDELGDGNGRKLRRNMFDRGLICIGAVPVADCKALCFLASDAVRSVNRLEVDPRGHIVMSTLGRKGRFANQLFQYACVKFYALRHGLTAALPPWEGNHLFDCKDEHWTGRDLPRLTYEPFADNDREIWDKDDPPVDVDLEGFFQEIPECWRRHRPLLRRLFQLPAEQLRVIDAWRDRVTDGGRRTLVAIHVRRGDYRKFQNVPYFRTVPEDWYMHWLRTIWPTLNEPVLFVGTDEPEDVLPAFKEFEKISSQFRSPADVLPDYVFDFEVMRRADYLAICNSSFSRMAAILAPSTQKCFLPSFKTQSFELYEPWMDPAFWARFASPGCAMDLRDKAQDQSASKISSKRALDARVETATVLFDVSDLLFYLLEHTTVSPIQRVQCEIVRHMLDTPHAPSVRCVFLNKRGELGSIESFALLDLVQNVRDTALVQSKLRMLLQRAVPCKVRPLDMFLTTGAFWNTSRLGALLQQVKKSGASIGTFIQDLLPLTVPEYFEPHDTRMFVKPELCAERSSKRVVRMI